VSSLRAFALTIFAFLMLPGVAGAQSGPTTGGTAYVPPTPPAPTNLTVPGVKAKLMPDGTAAAPADAPVEVQQAIWAANTIQDKPYKYGGGHAKIEDNGYDCSGTVSYALIHAGLLKSPLPSGPFMRWGERGRGQWITVFANGGHAYAVIAGLRLDTSSYASRIASKRKYKKAMERGPRWRPSKRPARGFKKRHPVGF
jgi:hypothetical protein